MMSNRAEVAAIEARDAVTYGSRHGPTWDRLVARGREEGLRGGAARRGCEEGLRGDALYDSVRQSASQTNDAVDGHFGL